MCKLKILSAFIFCCLFTTALPAQIIYEDFEGIPLLTNAINIPSGDWTQWDLQSISNPNYLEGLITDEEAANGEQSFLITDSDNIILKLGNKSSGVYTLEWNMFVKVSDEAEAAYFNFQKNETPGIEWGAQLFFYNDGIGIIDAFTENIYFGFNLETWFKVTHIIDLDADLITMYIDDIEIGNWPVSSNFGPIGNVGLKILGGINFNSLNYHSKFYLDDVVFLKGNVYQSLIKGKMRNDEDKDCQVVGTESGLKDFNIRFQGSNGAFITPTDANGEYYWFAPLGDYSVSVIPPINYWEICSHINQIQVTNFEDTTIIDFAARSVVDCPAMMVDITAAFLRRCFSNTLYIHYCNGGSIAANPVTIIVELDPLFVYQSSSVPFSSQNGNVLIFDLGQVAAQECGDFNIQVMLDCQATLGQEHCYSAQIFPDTLCNGARPIQSFTTECQNNIGSFDPNDKKVFPKGVGEEFTILPNQPLKYQIRFQNTGTDTAFSVVIVDTISPMLDLTSLRMGASSHPFSWTIEKSVLRLRFENILLPDSTTNEAGSHGFVNFFLNQIPDLPNGTLLENNAAIYFDFNEPVLTNTIWNTVDENVAAKEIQPSFITFDIYPNPAKKSVSIILKSKVPLRNTTIELFNSNGKSLYSTTFNSPPSILELPNLVSGIYWLRMMDGTGGIGIKKFIVMN